MNVIATTLPGVVVIEPTVHGDERGFFLESYHALDFAAIGIPQVFVQDNYSRSRQGVLRGLHYQLGKPQAKLVRVVQGEVFDVAVDIRRGSPTFGRFASTVLSAHNKRSFFVPEGFAHGFYVMSDMAEFIYKCTDFYAPSEERGLIWNDPALDIPWPLASPEPVLSAKDRTFGTLATRPQSDLPSYRYEANSP
ncbi:MAG: dTDP-4-dehydrorhamnose 3,5-epimerase [Planctomycetes bacterium]|nr:dTDP-4-dehydrorhamnose 3,5-epimerase [Planctomycetota bacterium]